jgi:hypothetical protein
VLFVSVVGFSMRLASAEEEPSVPADMCGVRPGALDATVQAGLYEAPEVGQISSFDAMSSLTSLAYSSYVFTTDDLVFFSYEDGTQLEVYDSSGNPVSFTPDVLNEGQHVRIDTSQGVYLVGGSRKFAVLTGDATVRGVCGYYAMDAAGAGVSRQLYTYVPALYGHCEFVVFAYEDNTTVTVEQDSSNGYYQYLASFSLNKGQHWSRSDLSNKYLHISADKPVSVLTSYDQSYFVPAAGGKWTGTEFYTYVNDIQSDPEDLTVIAYDGGTSVLIKDSVSQETIWQGTLQSGQARTQRYRNGADRYITVLTDKTVAVAVQPWKSAIFSYAQGVFVPDRTGWGVGTEFIGTTLADGYLYILAYSDHARVDVFDSLTGVWRASYDLDEGQAVNANPGNGLWKVVSNQVVSVHSGCETHTAEFAPLAFNQYRVRLSKTDDVEDGDCRSPGQEVTYTICWDNGEGSWLEDAYIVDRLPAGVTYPEGFWHLAPNMTPVEPDPAYDPDTHSYAWPLGLIDPNASGCVELTVVVNEYVEPGTFLVNEAELWSTVYDSNGLNPTSAVAARAFGDTLVCCWDTDGIVYVDENATGADNGFTWGDAYVDLQDALARARRNECPQDYVIYVAQGTYSPGDDEADTFEMPENVCVYGGFKTGGCAFAQRNPEQYKTTLTGRIDETHRNDTLVTTGDNTLISGFTITEAAEYGIYGSDADFVVEECKVEKGDNYGVRAVNGNVACRWCTITANKLDGIRHEGTGYTLTVENCWIRQSSRYGIHCIGSTPIIKNSIVSESDMSEAGNAGIRMINPTYSPFLQNVTVAHNKAVGILLAGSTLPDMENCIIYHNNDGGAQLSGFTADDAAWYSCIEDCNDVNFNINADPQFAYFDPDNVRIAYDSPCKDAGNTLLNYDEQVDMDGRVRVLEATIDMGAYEVSCEDGSNAWDWNADGRVNMGEFARLARVWRAHDPDDPALGDPNHPHYEYVSDPNSPGYVRPESLALWSLDGYRYNLSDVGYSQYAIDLADLVILIERPEWLVWQACWREESVLGEMMTSGDGEESMTYDQSALTLEAQAVHEESTEDEVLDLARVIVRLEDIWLTDSEIQQEIDANNWQRFMEALYNSLSESYIGTGQME